MKTMVEGDYEYCEEALQYTKQVLDDIDIRQIAIDHPNLETVYELEMYLIGAYENRANNEYMQGNLLNWMSHEEFVDYLCERYGDLFRPIEVTQTYIKFI